ncbi:M56 family metallopeptidase [Janibacter alkaliphilus]|uniref:Zn-dependent protease with chaperone function n=1 Tax=Janibacter alkaliphilus TaxID=1069963 RepID=A0A852XCE6_9MICO|nr:Zn-dependent protease with chaperone function [Janibacter alkaliphilus]
MIPVALVVTGLALVVAPRFLAGWTGIRRTPRAALFLWQGFALSAVLCFLLAGPVALAELVGGDDPAMIAVTLLTGAVSVLVLAHLLANGRRIGRRLRAQRRDHREVIDLVARHQDGRTRVLAHDAMGAYCVPGDGARVVLTEATLQRLDDAQLDAVLAHEDAHLRERHDLVLEFFSVLHTAAPPRARAEAALAEVRLLVEVLADRAAAARTSPVVLARALVALTSARHPDGSLGAGTSTTEARIRLLVADEPAWRTALIYAAAALVVLLPLLLVGAAIIT